MTSYANRIPIRKWCGEEGTHKRHTWTVMGGYGKRIKYDCLGLNPADPWMLEWYQNKRF